MLKALCDVSKALPTWFFNDVVIPYEALIRKGLLSYYDLDWWS